MAVFLRSRDVRSILKEKGYEMGTVEVLERMCDEAAGNRENMAKMTELIDMLATNVARMVEVGDHARSEIQELKRREQQYRELPHGGAG